MCPFVRLSMGLLIKFLKMPAHCSSSWFISLVLFVSLSSAEIETNPPGTFYTTELEAAPPETCSHSIIATEMTEEDVGRMWVAKGGEMEPFSIR